MDVNDDQNLVAQLEEIMKETGNWPTDNFLGMNNQANSSRTGSGSMSNEEQAIDRIKRSLEDDPLLIPQQQQQQQQSSGGDNRQSIRALQQQLGSGLTPQQQQQLSQMVLNQGAMSAAGGMGGPAGFNSGGGQALKGQTQNFAALRGQQQRLQQGAQQQQQSLQQQQQQFNQPRATVTHPAGPLAHALRPAGLNSQQMMVRQNLLHQVCVSACPYYC